MAKYRLITLTQRAKDILQTEGLSSLIRKTSRFLTSFLFKYKTYYLYHDTLDAKTQVDYVPKVKEFTLKIVHNNEQADELAAAGFECRYPYDISRERLDKGAILFCIFVNKELAHKACICTTEAAKRSFTSMPFRVNFSENEVYEGYVETNSKYRGLGLWLYCYFVKVRFLRQRKVAAYRYIVNADNIIQQRKLAELGVMPYAKATSLTILWFRSWKEQKLH